MVHGGSLCVQNYENLQNKSKTKISALRLSFKVMGVNFFFRKDDKVQAAIKWFYFYMSP
jgi:hypothetical protein